MKTEISKPVIEFGVRKPIASAPAAAAAKVVSPAMLERMARIKSASNRSERERRRAAQR